ncbi:MAG TPA: hypothetical protein VN688_14220 [Gemmataceae bacterium]|nr:hypothetical protein [Gemmataceae bacterium]
MRKWIVQALTPILVALALLLGVVALGRGTRAALHDRAAYTLALTDIDCEAPEGLSREEFLGEVRSLAHVPDRLHLLDEDLPARLAQAFAIHPWVESVRRVELRGTGSQVRVELIPRQAVLAVCLSGEKIPRDGSALIETWTGVGRNALMPARAVDRQGVLLPVAAVHSHLPVLITDVAAPAGSAGTYWGDPRVAAAAATVTFLKPHLRRLRLADCDLEMVQGEVVFRKPGVRVVWGHAPGQETTGEATAAIKLHRLLDYQSGHDGLESLEHDVRLLAFQGHFPLPANDEP